MVFKKEVETTIWIYNVGIGWISKKGWNSMRDWNTHKTDQNKENIFFEKLS